MISNLLKFIPLLILLALIYSPAVQAAPDLAVGEDNSNTKLAQINIGRNFIANNFKPAGAPDTPELLILNIIRGILSVLAAIASAAIIYGGFLYVTSTGNEEQARRAKMTLVYAAIGLIIIGLSVIIVNAFINITRGG